MKLKDSTMYDRLSEEIFKLGNTNRQVAQKVGCSSKMVSHWLSGRDIPSAYYLKSLYEAGADIIYILTGERE